MRENIERAYGQPFVATWDITNKRMVINLGKCNPDWVKPNAEAAASMLPSIFNALAHGSIHEIGPEGQQFKDIFKLKNPASKDVVE